MAATKVTGAAQSYVAARGVPRYIIVQDADTGTGTDVGMAIVREAVAAANQTMSPDLATGTNLVTGFEGVYVRVAGMGSGADKKAWLLALAAALDARDVTAVVGRPIRRHGSPEASEALRSARPVSAILVSTTEGRGREMAPRLRAHYTGDATHATVGTDGAGISMPVGAELDEFLLSNPNPAMRVTLEGTSTLARLNLGPSYAIGAPLSPGDWREHVELCRTVMIEESAELSYAVARRADTGTGWWTLQQDPPLPPTGIDAGYYLRRPNNWSDQVVDVHGLQVLTTGHLDRAHDLSNWKIESLGHDRVLVEASDLAPWYQEPEPDPETLARARADFGRMIVTVEDIKTRTEKGLDPWPLP